MSFAPKASRSHGSEAHKVERGAIAHASAPLAQSGEIKLLQNSHRNTASIWLSGAGGPSLPSECFLCFGTRF